MNWVREEDTTANQAEQPRRKTTPNGTARVFLTPQGVPGERWTLEINGTVIGTFPSDTEAMLEADRQLLGRE